MNIQQLTSLKASLCVLRVRVDNSLDELQQAIDELLAPDAGLVVVSRPYCMWMSVTDYGLFCEWDYRWMVADGWRYTGCRIVFAASGWMSHEVNISPSYLTIADARGEGEVGVDCHPNVVWRGFRPYAGPDPRSMHIGWWDSLLGSFDAWAFNHNYLPDSGRWSHHPDESTVLDCAAAHTPMTWRSA